MATLGNKPPPFDLRHLTPEFFADPYPVYRQLREAAPVCLMPDGSYFLTRHRDLDEVYRDTKTYSSDKKIEFLPKYGDTPLYEHHTTSLVFNDPPLHTRVRRLIAGALTPRAIADMEGGLIALVDQLLDNLEDKREADLIEFFASAIPVEIIGNLLGVPREERGPLREWSLAILIGLEPTLTPVQEARGNAAVTEFLTYLDDLVARRRAQPGDPSRDVLTRLIQGEADGEKLTSKELLHNCIFLLNAGHETTTNLIGNGLELLARYRQQRQRLLAEPHLIMSAVEEILRFESSNQIGNRMTALPAELSGVKMPAGTRITLCIAAANRDPEQFADPEVFDIARTPNRHLAFGAGPHVCVGLSLARLEGRIALGRFVKRFPDYEILPGAVRGQRARFRGFQTLPARVRT